MLRIISTKDHRSFSIFAIVFLSRGATDVRAKISKRRIHKTARSGGFGDSIISRKLSRVFNHSGLANDVHLDLARILKLVFNLKGDLPCKFPRLEVRHLLG